LSVWFTIRFLLLDVKGWRVYILWDYNQVSSQKGLCFWLELGGIGLSNLVSLIPGLELFVTLFDRILNPDRGEGCRVQGLGSREQYMGSLRTLAS